MQDTSTQAVPCALNCLLSLCPSPLLACTCQLLVCESLPSLGFVRRCRLRPQEINARNMMSDIGFSVPWDLHPRSLRAEFAHNTDLFATLINGSITASRDAGVYADSEYGLGGGLCRDVLRDGTPGELVGRLCIVQGREAAIEAAIRTAELPRPLRAAETRRSQVLREALGWRIDGPRGTCCRKLVKVSGTAEAANLTSAGRRWQLGKGARGKRCRHRRGRKGRNRNDC